MIHAELYELVLNIALAGVLAFALMKIYVRYGKALTNRAQLANNFVPLAMVVAFIISVVRSSLSLSLGLVGALSIIRFRTAIKDPEELVFLFTTVAIGLGIGAGQTALTASTAFLFFITIILMRKRNDSEQQRLFLTARARQIPQNELNVSKVVETLKKSCSNISVSRLDSTADNFEVTCVVDLPELSKMSTIEKDLRNLAPDMKVTFITGTGDF